MIAVGSVAVGQVKGSIAGKRSADSVRSIALQVKEELLACAPVISVNVNHGAVSCGAILNIQRRTDGVARNQNVRAIRKARGTHDIIRGNAHVAAHGVYHKNVAVGVQVAILVIIIHAVGPVVLTVAARNRADTLKLFELRLPVEALPLPVDSVISPRADGAGSKEVRTFVDCGSVIVQLTETDFAIIIGVGGGSAGAVVRDNLRVEKAELVMQNNRSVYRVNDGRVAPRVAAKAPAQIPRQAVSVDLPDDGGPASRRSAHCRWRRWA